MFNLDRSYVVGRIAQRIVSKRVEIMGSTLLCRRRTVCVVMSEKATARTVSVLMLSIYKKSVRDQLADPGAKRKDKDRWKRVEKEIESERGKREDIKGLYQMYNSSRRYIKFHIRQPYLGSQLFHR